MSSSKDSTKPSSSKITLSHKLGSHLNMRKPNKRFAIEDNDYNHPGSCTYVGPNATEDELKLHDYLVTTHREMESQMDQLGIKDDKTRSERIDGLYEVYYATSGQKSLADMSLTQDSRDGITLAVYNNWGPTLTFNGESQKAGEWFMETLQRERRKTSSEYSVDTDQSGKTFTQSVEKYAGCLPESEIGSRAMIKNLAESLVNVTGVTELEYHETTFLNMKSILDGKFPDDSLSLASTQVNKDLAIYLGETRFGIYRSAKERRDSQGERTLAKLSLN